MLLWSTGNLGSLRQSWWLFQLILPLLTVLVLLLLSLEWMWSTSPFSTFKRGQTLGFCGWLIGPCMELGTILEVTTSLLGVCQNMSSSEVRGFQRSAHMNGNRASLMVPVNTDNACALSDAHTHSFFCLWPLQLYSHSLYQKVASPNRTHARHDLSCWNLEKANHFTGEN